MRTLLMLSVLSATGSASVALPERAVSPSAATVFVRVVGTVEIQVDDPFEESVEKRGVELGTGSGFVFTPYGHVLTNYHVIAGGTKEVRIGRRRADVEVSVERVEVVLPSGSRDATVEAVDPSLDLAILAVVGEELPYLGLGDSDAAAGGAQVQVFGFPFGRRVEVGMANLPDIVPRVSVTRGAISAARVDGVGNTAYLQTSATVNPGNSGGPMVDEDGYVLGIVRLKLVDADGIGFAIPINTVKDFLTANGYDGLLPVPRLYPGGEQTLEEKGLSLRLPDTIEDISPVRLKVLSDPAAGPVRLAVDRVFTPLGVTELETLLLEGATFGGFRAEGEPRFREAGDGRIRGWVRGGEETMAYAVVDVGEEKVVARYEGPADAMAFNRSVAEGSLRSLQAVALMTPEPKWGAEVRWEGKPLPAPGSPDVAVPAGWYSEVSAPFPCRGAPLPDTVSAFSPVEDFTVSFRAGWWEDAGTLGSKAGTCGGRRGGFAGDAYLYSVDWLGVRYIVEGTFVPASTGGALQLEIVAPEAKRPEVRRLGAQWVERNLR